MNPMVEKGKRAESSGRRGGRMPGRSVSSPESIEDILKRWLKSNRIPDRLDRTAIYEKWKEVVGEAIACQTRVIDLNAGILTLEVNSPALLQELSTYYREDLLASLKEVEEFGSVREIRFRAGSF